LLDILFNINLLDIYGVICYIEINKKGKAMKKIFAILGIIIAFVAYWTFVYYNVFVWQLPLKMFS